MLQNSNVLNGFAYNIIVVFIACVGFCSVIFRVHIGKVGLFMDDNNLNEMIKKAQDMINNNQIPPELQGLVKNFTSGQNVQNHNSQYNNANNQDYGNLPSQNCNNQSNNSNNKSYNNQSSSNSGSQNSMPNLDMETLMKMQTIMSKMQNSSDNDMSRLLSSLKPYLRDDKKGKVDEYMKLVKMGQMTKILESLRW